MGLLIFFGVAEDNCVSLAADVLLLGLLLKVPLCNL